MPYSQTNAVIARFELRRTHHHATCWKLTRTDGTVYRYTDHDKTLTLLDGYNYVPGGGIDSTARSAEVGLKERNVTVRGFISADAFTTDDFRAGRWDNAQADEYVVDHRYPDIGYIRHDRYWFTLVPNFGSELWEAELTGLAARLAQTVGDVFTRNCRHDLGDAFDDANAVGCHYNVNGSAIFNEEVDSVSVPNPRRIFTVVNGTAPAAGTFDYGRVKCTSGANVGLEFEIREHTEPGASQHTIELETETYFDIEDGDLFHIFVGCNGTVTTCKALGQYPDNYGGFPFMPGPDKALQAPG